jgi:hypothetical protein
MGRLSDDELERRVDETAMASDRTFFKQHPQRNYRIRPAWNIEVEHLARHFEDPLVAPPPDRCWWIAVRRVAPGLRARFLFHAPDEPPSSEIPEKYARRIWEYLAPPECKD